MSFKAQAFLPPGVSVYPRYDTQLISGAISKLKFFLPTPGTVDDADNNYVANPFPGATNVVLLGISLSATQQIITDDSANSIDAAKITNSLYDSVLRLDTNGGREQKVLEPVYNYMNFAQSRSQATGDATNGTVNQVVLQSTGPRKIPNYFFFSKSESFQLYLEFPGSSVTFPTTANWTTSAQSGRGGFGIKATLWTADMNEAQLAQFNAKLNAAAN
ncbi:MAG TPA: hypothetical protein VE870_05555 [Bacteroidales bacterium]|nr:hypothetical protein [Bacteroidales bacterium]